MVQLFHVSLSDGHWSSHQNMKLFYIIQFTFLFFDANSLNMVTSKHVVVTRHIINLDVFTSGNVRDQPCSELAKVELKID